MADFYGCIELTENEHLFVEDDIGQYCENLGMELVYYRKLIHPESKVECHVPMIREFKVEGTESQINRFKAWLKEEKLTDHMGRNPHTLERKYGTSFQLLIMEKPWGEWV